jgi:hypothetical protein
VATPPGLTNIVLLLLLLLPLLYTSLFPKKKGQGEEIPRRRDG